jgi:hypothetical protein
MAALWLSARLGCALLLLLFAINAVAAQRVLVADAANSIDA